MKEVNPPALVAPAEASLAELAGTIREEHEVYCRARRATVASARKLGAWLNEAKRKAGHGNWLPWLKANVPDISESTAQRCMRLAGRLEEAAAAKGVAVTDLEEVSSTATVTRTGLRPSMTATASRWSTGSTRRKRSGRTGGACSPGHDRRV